MRSIFPQKSKTMADVTENTPWRCKTCGEIVRDADLYDHIRHHHNPDYDECAESPYRYFEGVPTDLEQIAPDLCNLFEKFLQTIDYVLGGGDTVARFRDRYKELTGKKVRIIGDPMNEEEV